jgi:ABC-type transport system involved in multi-copper enzyme maturation permease subunit
MSIAMPTIPRHMETTQKARPLLTVIGWELRRIRASKVTWVMAGVAFCLFFFFAWWNPYPNTVISTDSAGRPHTFHVDGTSAWGMLSQLSTYISIVTIFAPFVSTDPMARDLKRGTHELLMTTRISSWTYAWGRYLVMMLLSLSLAVEMLIAILCMGWFYYFLGSNYPAPQVSAVILLWAAVILPYTILLSSLGFALGTWLPRHTGLLIAGMIISLTLVMPMIMQHLPDSFLQWDPTSITKLSEASNNEIMRIGSTQGSFPQNFLHMEQQIPDIWPWLPPHLIWMGLGITLVFLAISSFRRFKNVAPQQTTT